MSEIDKSYINNLRNEINVLSNEIRELERENNFLSRGIERYDRRQMRG